MTAVGASQLALMGDGFKALGFGFVLSLSYHLFRLLLPVRGVILNAVLHAAFFCVSGLFFFCYILGQTVSEAPRWYMFAALALAAAVYCSTSAKRVNAAARAAARAFSKITRPVKALAERALGGLQRAYKLLYNRITQGLAARAARRRKGNVSGRTQRAKEPVKVYTQT